MYLSYLSYKILARARRGCHTRLIFFEHAPYVAPVQSYKIRRHTVGVVLQYI